MKKNKCAGIIPATCLCLLCAACGGDGDGDYFYPSLVTEFVELQTDATGTGTTFTTDKGETFAVNTPLQGLQPEAAYRIVCGYETNGETRGNLPVARIYTVDNVILLEPADSSTGGDAPTGIAAVWHGGNYLNLQLTPKTQGGEQQWNYHVDSVSLSTGRQVHHLSLWHSQPDDPFSYSTTVYASLPLRQLEGLQPGDSLTFTVLTFDGPKTWQFNL